MNLGNGFLILWGMVIAGSAGLLLLTLVVLFRRHDA